MVNEIRNEWDRLCYSTGHPFPDDSFETRFNQFGRVASAFRLLASTKAEDHSCGVDDFVDIAGAFICELAERADMWWCEHGKDRGRTETVRQAVDHVINAYRVFECDPTIATLDRCEMLAYADDAYRLLAKCLVVAGRPGHYDDRQRVWFWDQEPKLTTIDKTIIKILAGKKYPMRQSEVCEELRKMEGTHKKGEDHVRVRLARLNRYRIINNHNRQGYILGDLPKSPQPKTVSTHTVKHTPRGKTITFVNEVVERAEGD